MKRNEQILLFTLVGVVLMWLVVLPAASRIVIEPTQERYHELQSLQLRIQEKESEQLDILQSSRRIKDWKERSLPPEAFNAQRLYQEWITDLAHLSGMSQLKVTPDRRIPRGQTYVAVQVSLEGQATLEQLSRFLFHFERANLLHRIVRMDLGSRENRGNPSIRVSLLAEGLALQDARKRDRLFPEASLEKDLPLEATRIPIEKSEGFPATGPFRVRIGNEYLLVTEVAPKSWKVVRGIDSTKPLAHAAGQRIELSLINPHWTVRSFDDFEPLIVENPFATPAPPRIYEPRLEPIRDQIVFLGEKLELTVRAIDFNPSLGELHYSLEGELADELEIDSETGRLTWEPADDLPAGEYEFSVVVEQGIPSQVERSETFRVLLREPNRPPVLARIPPQTVYLGQSLVFTAEATDEDAPENRWTFRLDNAPAGASIDSRTGRFEWNPGSEIEPGDFDVTVIVEDDGSPALSDRQEVRLTVKEDEALFTYLIGVIAEGAERRAWLYDRLTNRRLTLLEGREFEVADLRARVLNIEDESVLLRIGEQQWKLLLGDNLRTMILVDDAQISARSPSDSKPLASEDRIQEIP